MPSFSRAVLAVVGVFLLVPAVAVTAPGPLPEPRGSCTISNVPAGTCTTTCDGTTISVSSTGVVDVRISGVCRGFGIFGTASCTGLFTCSNTGANVFPPVATLSCTAAATIIIITATCSSP